MNLSFSKVYKGSYSLSNFIRLVFFISSLLQVLVWELYVARNKINNSA